MTMIVPLELTSTEKRQRQIKRDLYDLKIDLKEYNRHLTYLNRTLGRYITRRSNAKFAYNRAIAQGFVVSAIRDIIKVKRNIEYIETEIHSLNLELQSITPIE